MKNKFILFHSFGNQQVYAILRALNGGKQLFRYYTSFAYANDSVLGYLVNLFSLKQLKKKAIVGIEQNQIVALPYWDARRRLPFFKITSHQVTELLMLEVEKKIQHNFSDFSCIYAFPNMAENLFVWAKQARKKCIYDFSTAHPENYYTIFEEEKSKGSPYTIETTIYANRKLAEQIERELSLADLVLVACSYVKNTFVQAGVELNKIIQLPYGFPTVSPKEYEKGFPRKLKLLYVGSHVHMKGFSYLLESVEALREEVELTIVSSSSNDEKKQIAMLRHRFLGNLSHQDVLAEMKKADVFLFPSLSEGFGMVITESMSQGTPVIATTNSIAPDIIVDGENGWIIPPASTTAIVDKIKKILAAPETIEYCGRNALKTASARPWKKYEEELLEILQKI